MSFSIPAFDIPVWRVVRQLYYEDKVMEAMQEAERLGGLDSNHLYAEAESRQKGTQFKLRPWLTLEAIESEIPVHLSEITNLVGVECEGLSKHFGWDNRESTLVTILPKDVEAPWMPGRWGYFVDKVPYDKICLPYHLTANPRDFQRTIRHEFMHDVTLNLTHGRASRWVEEAMSTYAEGRMFSQEHQGFQSGQLPWVNPNELDANLATDNRREDRHLAIIAGYAQANLIARFLAQKFGDPTLGELLKALGDAGVWEALKEGLFSRSAVDSALHHVYGLTEKQIFEEAHQWVMSPASLKRG